MGTGNELFQQRREVVIRIVLVTHAGVRVRQREYPIWGWGFQEHRQITLSLGRRRRRGSMDSRRSRTEERRTTQFRSACDGKVRDVRSW